MKSTRDLLKNSQVRLWLAIAGSVTIVIGTAYGMVQQATRQGANDLPLSTAQTYKTQLEQGAAPQDIVPKTTVNLRTDSGLFVTVADKSNKVLASNVSLDGQVSLPPRGTLNYAKAHSSDRFTWQPVSGVREATQILAYKNGYIVTGQSLRPFENRINTYTLLAILGWLATMAWTFTLLLLPTRSAK